MQTFVNGFYGYRQHTLRSSNARLRSAVILTRNNLPQMSVIILHWREKQDLATWNVRRAQESRRSRLPQVLRLDLFICTL